MKAGLQNGLSMAGGGAVAVVFLYLLFALSITPAPPAVPPTDNHNAPPVIVHPPPACVKCVPPPTPTPVPVPHPSPPACPDNGRHTGWFTHGHDPVACTPHHHDNGQGRSDQPPMGPPGQTNNHGKHKGEGHGHGDA